MVNGELLNKPATPSIRNVCVTMASCLARLIYGEHSWVTRALAARGPVASPRRLKNQTSAQLRLREEPQGELHLTPGPGQFPLPIRGGRRPCLILRQHRGGRSKEKYKEKTGPAGEDEHIEEHIFQSAQTA